MANHHKWCNYVETIVINGKEVYGNEELRGKVRNILEICIMKNLNGDLSLMTSILTC